MSKHSSEQSHVGCDEHSQKRELWWAIASLVIVLSGVAFSQFSQKVAIVFYLISFAIGLSLLVGEAWESVKNKAFSIDQLMIMAALGAMGLGEHFDAAFLLALFAIGHALEEYAMNRARNEVKALSKLAPDTALLLQADGGEREVGAATLVVGDRIRVLPNSRIAADGFVILGTSPVNQAAITGESIPADKVPVDDASSALANPKGVAAHSLVYAGSINGNAALEIIVLRVSSENTIAKMANLIANAESSPSNFQRFTSNVEKYLVPGVIALFFVLLFAWVVVDESFSVSLRRALSALVASSPCALAIATPSAVLAGVARAAKMSILIKGGAQLEALATINAIAFDKTGTLTEGKPRLTDVEVAAGVDKSEFLSTVIALERQSDHPLALAVTDDAKKLLPAGFAIPQATAVSAVIGAGIEGIVDGYKIRIGKPAMFHPTESWPSLAQDAVNKLKSNGRTLMMVFRGEQFMGVLGVMDTQRPDAQNTLAELSRVGITKTVMLTGDNQVTADKIAKDLGVSVAKGDLLPENKVEEIKILLQQGLHVAMVGDGVNDGPALATATVGIAMGMGGSDVALETADVVLMSDGLRDLPFGFALAQQSTRIIKQNLWLSLGMVAVLVPLTISGLAEMRVAVVLHEGSTLLIVANALRLLRFRR